MRTKFTILLLLISSLMFGQGANYVWPISGAKTGSDLLYTPQSYVDTELNFDGLYIAAPYGTEVVSPVDGEIQDLFVEYKTRLDYTSMTDVGRGLSFNEALKSRRKNASSRFNTIYICGTISILTKSGEVIHITGLEGDLKFKTGEKIKAGEPLGTVGYSYHKIAEPSIGLFILKNKKPSDPMSPFGLRTSFIPPKESVVLDSITKEQAHKDLDILFGATEELLPSLYKIVTQEEYAQLKVDMLAKIDAIKTNKISTYQFRRFVTHIFNNKIHDSHISVYPYSWVKNGIPDAQPGVFIGWEDGVLKLYLTSEEYGENVGKEIVEVNGVSADSAMVLAMSGINSYDADVRSMVDYRLAYNAFGALAKFDKDDNLVFDMSFKFADGSSVDIPQVTDGLKETYKLHKYILTNKSDRGFDTKMINSSTAYLGISTFSLSDAAVDEIGLFVDSVSKARIPNFIVDVRNNPGGAVDKLERIFSYFTMDTVEVSSYSRVNKVANFDYLDYTMNYAGEDTLFHGFALKDGEEGYFGNFSKNVMEPDSLINYRGRLYVLTNENSGSAATVFPAMVVRSHRGMVVGRETQSAYHYITAVKFADLRLPNSTLTIRLPLVEEWFDTVVNERVPFGRGVVPDYEIPITHSELLSENGDVILNKTLELIDKGVYIDENNPFDMGENSSFDAVAEIKDNMIITLSLLAISALLLGFLLGNRKRRRRR